MEGKTYQLGDVVNCLDYKRVPLSSKVREDRRGIYPYYGAQGIVDYVDDYIFDGTYLLVAEDGENLRSQNEHIANLASGKYWVNNHAHILESNGKCDIRFVCYYLNNLDIRGYITGSAQPKLNQDNLLSIKLLLPDLKEQTIIADVLDGLDKKIALNTRMNAELEAMAKHLYDYWFVQFDFPDENGNPYKSSGGKMVYNPTLKREIPAGWEIRSLNQLAASYRGVTYNKEDLVTDSEESILVLRGNNIPYSGQFAYDGNVAFIPRNMILEEQKINKGDIIITMSSGSKEHIGKCYMFQRDSDHTFGAFLSKFVPSQKNRYFTYLSMLSDFFKAFVKTTCNGTGINNLTNATFDDIFFPLPQTQILNEFEKIVESIYNQVGLCQKQNVDFTHLRDSLLPMLMNGQVTVE